MNRSQIRARPRGSILNVAEIIGRRSVPRLLPGNPRAEADQMYASLAGAYRIVRDQLNLANQQLGMRAERAGPINYPRVTPRATAEQAAENENQAYLLDAFYQTQLTPIPRPADWNWMYRLVNIWPTMIVATQDFQLMRSIPTAHMMQIAMVSFALYRALTTTVLYAFNVTGANMHQYAANMVMQPVLNGLLRDSLFALPSVYSEQSALVFELVHALLFLCTGQKSEKNALFRERWNARPGADPDITPYRSPYLTSLHLPIQRVPVLAIGTWLQVRPVEWGISTPSPQTAIGNLVDLHNSARRGFYVRLGTDEFDKKALSPDPGDLISYAARAINCATQGWLGDCPWPRLRYQTYVWAYGNVPNYAWPTIQPVPAPHAEYEHTGILQPCTVMTYDHLTENVLSPVLVMEDINEHTFVNMRASGLVRNPTIGIFKTGRAPITEYVTAASSKAIAFFKNLEPFNIDEDTAPRTGPTRSQSRAAFNLPASIFDIDSVAGQVAQKGGVLTNPEPAPIVRLVTPQPSAQPVIVATPKTNNPSGGVANPEHPQLPKPQPPPAPTRTAKRTRKEIEDELAAMIQEEEEEEAAAFAAAAAAEAAA